MKPEDFARQGFKQTSRKYRCIAKLRDGVDPLEAVKQTNPVWYDSLIRMVESQMLRCYDTEFVVTHTFETPEEMDKFRKAGGDAA